LAETDTYFVPPDHPGGFFLQNAAGIRNFHRNSPYPAFHRFSAKNSAPGMAGEELSVKNRPLPLLYIFLFIFTL